MPRPNRITRSASLAAIVSLAAIFMAGPGSVLAQATLDAPAKPPVAQKRPVEDRYFDTTVADDYQ